MPARRRYLKASVPCATPTVSHPLTATRLLHFVFLAMLSSAESPKVLCRPFLTRVLFHLLMLTLWPMFSVVVLSSLNINAVFAVANFLIPCFLLYM